MLAYRGGFGFTIVLRSRNPTRIEYPVTIVTVECEARGYEMHVGL